VYRFVRKVYITGRNRFDISMDFNCFIVPLRQTQYIPHVTQNTICQISDSTLR